MRDLPKISVCIPVRNGAERLPDCLRSLRALDYPAELIEIVIADGGSTDATAEIARSFGARVLDNPGRTVAAGRNVSFAAASGDFIASTDDDCVVPRDWIRCALQAFDTGDVAAVGGISLLPEAAQAWPQAANYVFRLASRGGYSVQADHLEAGDVQDLPGCNVIYKRTAVRAAGPFDERLVTAEDVDFHQRLLNSGQRLRTAPGLFVWHHKRPTLRGLFHQLRRYAEGRLQLGRKWPAALGWAHVVLGWAMPVIIMGALLWAMLAPLLLVVVTAVSWAAVTSLALRDGLSMKAALLVPAAALVVSAGWSTGYLKERFRPMPSAYGR